METHFFFTLSPSIPVGAAARRHTLYLQTIKTARWPNSQQTTTLIPTDRPRLECKYVTAGTDRIHHRWKRDAVLQCRLCLIRHRRGYRSEITQQIECQIDSMTKQGGSWKPTFSSHSTQIRQSGLLTYPTYLLANTPCIYNTKRTTNCYQYANPDRSAEIRV